MSETKKVKVSVIQSDAIVSLNISGAFHKRLVGAYFNFVKKFEPTKFEELCKVIASNSVSNLNEQDKIDAYSIETLLILMKDLENEFKNKGFIKQEDIEVPNEG